MFSSLPSEVKDFMHWDWGMIEPYFQDLLKRKLSGETVHSWLADWTQVSDLLSERYARLTVAITLDTEDKEAEGRYNSFLEDIYPSAQEKAQELKRKLLDSGLQPAGFELPLKRMQVEADIFRQENLPLLTQERKFSSQYNKIIGAQTVEWEGDELTLQQLRRYLQTQDREQRERVWRLGAERQLADRQAINQLWVEFMNLRGELARNAGASDYRAYRWKQMLRLDYTPQDCQRFQEAIAEVVVPAATQIYEKHRIKAGFDRLRPWDLDQDLYPISFPPLSPYGDAEELERKTEIIFRQLDVQLGEYFHIMRKEGLLDLENRKGKAPGGYCTSFPVARRPFIFMNAVGLPTDVRTLLHESGHAFHNFERYQLPYAQQRIPGLEFAEVASMAMELLASPFISGNGEGLYPPEEANRFRIQHLERIILFWPYMAVVDSFQHWVYTHHQEASQPENCDAKWLELWERYLPGVDWSGLEEEAQTGWHRKQHIYRFPFYYVEYGVAQLGAVQVWENAFHNPSQALENYRQALRLGGTVSLPELYRQAGASFAFDAKTLGKAVQLVMQTLDELESYT